MTGLWKWACLAFLLLGLSASSNAGEITEEVVCDADERLLANKTCEKCPSCQPGEGYPEDEDCGYGKGQNMTCRPCSPGKYRDWKDTDNRCKTCLDCTADLKKKFEFQCRPEIDAKCGSCLPGYEENEMSSDFLPMPWCQPCTKHSTSESCLLWERQMEEEAASAQERVKMLDENENLVHKVQNLTAENARLEFRNDALHSKNAKAVTESRQLSSDHENVKIALIVLGCIFLVTVIALSAFCLCCHRNGKCFGTNMKGNVLPRHRGSHVDPNRTSDVRSTSPLIIQPVKQMEGLQGAVGIQGAEPQHQLDGEDVESQASSHQTGAESVATEEECPQTVTTIDGPLNSLSSGCSSLTPPMPFSIPISGYYSMTDFSTIATGSEASTALVQNSPPFGDGSYGYRALLDADERNSNVDDSSRGAVGGPPRNSGGHPDGFDFAPNPYDSIPAQRDLPVDRQNSSDPSLSRSGVNINPRRRVPDNTRIAAVHNFHPPRDAARNLGATSLAPHQDLPGAGPDRGASHHGARPKQTTRNSSEQEADYKAFEAALAACGGKVVQLTEEHKQRLGCILTPSNPPIDGTPNFHGVADKLGIDYHIYKSWCKGAELVRYMCDQNIYLRPLLEVLHRVRMVAARDYLAWIINRRGQAQPNRGNGQDGLAGDERLQLAPMALHHDPPRNSGTNGEYGGNGSAQTRNNSRVNADQNCGVAQDVQNIHEELRVDDSTIPIVVEQPDQSVSENGRFSSHDDSQGAAAATPPIEESKGSLPYPISETNRDSQPLTPPPNEMVDPFRVR